MQQTVNQERTTTALHFNCFCFTLNSVKNKKPCKNVLQTILKYVTAPNVPDEDDDLFWEVVCMGCFGNSFNDGLPYRVYNEVFACEGAYNEYVINNEELQCVQCGHTSFLHVEIPLSNDCVVFG